MDVVSMKGFRRIPALLLAACVLIVNGFAQAASDADKPCGIRAPEPPLAYPLPAYTVRDIAAMFVPPRTSPDLLSNLKIVLDRQLLAQPAFFDDDVLHTLFNATDVQWMKPGTPGAVSERVVKPTRIAHVRVDEGGALAGIKVYAGVNHKCLDRRAHPDRPDVVIPAHTYDSGYLYLQLDGPAVITIGDVRRAFGSHFVEFERECRSPLSLYYVGPAGPSQDAFRLHEANFYPSAVGYGELCRAAPGGGVPDDQPVSHAWIRLVEEDYTIPGSINP
jgi:hypothetical protein